MRLQDDEGAAHCGKYVAKLTEPVWAPTPHEGTVAAFNAASNRLVFRLPIVFGNA